MIETVKALPGLIKGWKTNSDLIYQLSGCIAGTLTISAYIREQRPSEVLSDIMRAVGASGISAWLKSDLPPLLAEPHIVASHALVCLAALAILTMLFKPFFNAQRNNWTINLQARGLLGSRAAVTMWTLLMFAAQLASLTWAAERLRSGVAIAAIVTVLISLLLGVAYYVTRRQEWYSKRNGAGDWLTLAIFNASTVVVMTGFSLVFVVVGPILGAIFWLCATESNAYSDVKQKVAEEEALKYRTTGALSS